MPVNSPKQQPGALNSAGTRTDGRRHEFPAWLVDVSADDESSEHCT